MSTEEMINRYFNMLGQYDRTVLHDDEEAPQRLAEVSDTLIGHARLLMERLIIEREEEEMNDLTRLLAQSIRRTYPDCPRQLSDSDVVVWLNDNGNTAKDVIDILDKIAKPSKAAQLRWALDVILSADPVEVAEMFPEAALAQLARIAQVQEMLEKGRQQE